MSNWKKLLMSAFSLAAIALAGLAQPAEARRFPCSACADSCGGTDPQDACDEQCFGWQHNLVCYPHEPQWNYCDEGQGEWVVQCEDPT